MNFKKIILKDYIKIIISFIILGYIVISLYYGPIVSEKPLGLDSIGHLSRVKYVQTYPFSQWKTMWYGGMPLLESYSPLFFYLLSMFSNIFLWNNILLFGSLFLTSFGIFLLVFYKTKKLFASLISGISYLTVLAISYFYIATGNIPFAFSLFTIPFSLYFFEKTLKNKKNYFIFILFLLLSILLHILTGYIVIFLILIRIILLSIFNKYSFGKFFKLFVIFILPGILLSCFWLIPFLMKSSDYISGGGGYSPTMNDIFGNTDFLIWGVSPGQIGIIMYIFIILLLLIYFYYKNKYMRYILFSSVVFLLLTMGILGSHYPVGVSPVRFILPFSILLSIFIGVSLGSIKLNKYIKIIFIGVIFILILNGLYANYDVIQTNFNEYNYTGKHSRFNFMTNLSNNPNVTFNESYDNYRFGTNIFLFSETLNYFYPGQSQTKGYNSQGALNPLILNLMERKIWESDDLNSTLFFLDYFGIKYFELDSRIDLKVINKFSYNPEIFEKIFEISDPYSFKMYMYRNNSPIISVIKTNVKTVSDYDLNYLANNNINFKKILYLVDSKKGVDEIDISNEYEMIEFEWIRNNPDKIEVSFNSDSDSVVLFKEFHHASWRAREFPSKKNLKIYKTVTEHMVVLPSEESNRVVFYQSKTIADYIGIVLTFFGIFLLIYGYRNFRTR
ncbi:hypothetical protein GOV12_05175 [Candidatus Pacearchaeota archaeon]|nr:hypothetical protein [Candidatus Pacearchaeota archaeon]